MKKLPVSLNANDKTPTAKQRYAFERLAAQFLDMIDLLVAFVRIPIGLFLALFLPGYLFQRILFQNENDALEQLALAIGLSICLNVLSVMVMNLWFKIPINAWTILADIFVVCLLIGILGFFRKRLARISSSVSEGWSKPSAQTESRSFGSAKSGSLNKLQILSLVLLLGAFLYFFELFYHGYEQGDISSVNITLSFLAFLLFASLLFGLQYLKGRFRNLELLEFASFFIFAVVFFYLIFFLRTYNSFLSLLISFAYFGIVIFLAFNQGNRVQQMLRERYHFDNPFIRFSFRFFLVLGILIFPAGVLEFILTGQIDYRLPGISILMIQIITPPVQMLLSILGIASHATAVEGGFMLDTTTPHPFRVFIGLLCSGITSMSVFLAAFTAMAWDLKTSAGRKAVILGIGILGTVLSNVFRVTILVLVGIYFGNDALILMHTNLGWVLYFIWLTFFWIVAFRIAGKKSQIARIM